MAQEFRKVNFSFITFQKWIEIYTYPLNRFDPENLETFNIYSSHTEFPDLILKMTEL